jgi:hypothetical protein
VKCYCADEWDGTERADMVREAQNMIYDAIDLVEKAIKGHHYEDNWDAYVVAHLNHSRVSVLP